jgi:uncharacterized membrane protein
MIIMALDHTRDFFHETAMTADPTDMETTTAPLFFTRWITHFCAPTFVLLSGMSAYLSSRNKSAKEASTFFIKRGLWLVVVEITLVTFGLTFNPFFNFIILQVIWAIGVSMILLGIFSAISLRLTLVIGILLIVTHNALDYATVPKSGTASTLLNMFLTARGTIIPLNAQHIIGDFYAVLPWTGIMFVGFSMGSWFRKEFNPVKRLQLLRITGVAMIVGFIVLRFLKGYGDPGAWQSDGQHTFLSFLNTNKYPPSLQYTFMTLGPAILLLSVAENIKNRVSQVITVYGRVPFFYYILHFYILHILLAIIFFLDGHHSSEIANPASIFMFRPPTFGYPLPGVYLIWISVVASLYLPCRWFYKYKSTHNQWWLRYI